MEVLEKKKQLALKLHVLDQKFEIVRRSLKRLVFGKNESLKMNKLIF